MASHNPEAGSGAVRESKVSEASANRNTEHRVSLDWWRRLFSERPIAETSKNKKDGLDRDTTRVFRN